jgi:selenide,water dikinase
VLTKSIGSGVIATALKQGAAPPEVVAGAIEVMATLNRAGAEAMVATGVSAGTDVTGFGLLGHLHRMLQASGVSARLDPGAVPLLPGARDLAEAGHIPGGTTRNLEDLADSVTFAESVDPTTRLLLADAQTSGGLLISVPRDALDRLLSALEGATAGHAVIGSVGEGEPGRITVG